MQLGLNVLEGQGDAVADADRAHAEDGGVQGIADGGLPIVGDALIAVSHAEHGANGRAVAVGIETSLHCHTDGVCEVALAV